MNPSSYNRYDVVDDCDRRLVWHCGLQNKLDGCMTRLHKLSVT